MTSEEAIEIAGRLYGAIFLRNADEDGFKYYCGKLLRNEMQVSQAVFEMLASDEFAERFIYNRTPTELTENLLKTFFGSNNYTDAEFAYYRDMLLKTGFDKTAAAILEDARCAYIDEELKIPGYFDSN
jgi:hypothetical protein